MSIHDLMWHSSHILSYKIECNCSGFASLENDYQILKFSQVNGIGLFCLMVWWSSFVHLKNNTTSTPTCPQFELEVGCVVLDHVICFVRIQSAIEHWDFLKYGARQLQNMCLLLFDS